MNWEPEYSPHCSIYSLMKDGVIVAQAVRMPKLGSYGRLYYDWIGYYDYKSTGPVHRTKYSFGSLYEAKLHLERRVSPRRLEWLNSLVSRIARRFGKQFWHPPVD